MVFIRDKYANRSQGVRRDLLEILPDFRRGDQGMDRLNMTLRLVLMNQVLIYSKLN